MLVDPLKLSVFTFFNPFFFAFDSISCKSPSVILTANKLCNSYSLIENTQHHFVKLFQIHNSKILQQDLRAILTQSCFCSTSCCSPYCLSLEFFLRDERVDDSWADFFAMLLLSYCFSLEFFWGMNELKTAGQFCFAMLWNACCSCKRAHWMSCLKKWPQTCVAKLIGETHPTKSNSDIFV